MAHLNDAMKEAEVHHTTTACALQQVYKDSVLTLEHKAEMEEGWDHQAFVEAFGAAVKACPPETCGALLYSLQLLTSNVSLAAILGMSATTQLWAIADRGPAPAASIPSISEIPASQAGTKCQCFPQTRVCPSWGRKKRK